MPADELRTNRPMTASRVLVADDQEDVREALRLLLKAEGFVVTPVASPAAIVAAIERSDFDVVLMDLNYSRDTTSGAEGLDLVTRLQSTDATLAVVVMTAWGSIDLVVEAMRRGAKDFVQKPWDNTRLLATLRTQAELSRALRQARRLEAENRLLRDGDIPAVIADSPAMRAVLDLVARVAPSEAAVLLTGENGVGKGLVAELIHRRSPRAARPMITVNAGGLPEGTFESELFGHVRGAFTDARSDRLGRFDIADGSTLFLDEIGNVPVSLQGKLLHAIETGSFEPVGSSRTRRVDVRIISATNAVLPDLVAQGRFRQDLQFRINTVEIVIPPLRNRREDIAPLAEFFLERHARRYGKDGLRFDEAARRLLQESPWPGNVRELAHCVERAVLLASGDTIHASDLGITPASPSVSLEEASLDDVEKLLIEKALAKFGGNVSHAARALGLSRSALYRRLKKHGL